MTHSTADLQQFIPKALAEVRSSTPLIQCITNYVVANFTANALLAVGASPAMVDVPTEAGPFAEIASGLLINIGTPNPMQSESLVEAAKAANAAGTPWVLDPVAVGFLAVRTQLGFTARDLNPTIVRGNASEIIAVSEFGSGGRGTDATDSVAGALPAAQHLAKQTGAIVAISGEVDAVTDGTEVIHLANGDALLTKVTGGGCALGAILAAFAAVDEDRLATTVAGISVYNIAAEIAAEQTSGPGSFAVALLDALANIDAETLLKLAKIS